MDDGGSVGGKEKTRKPGVDGIYVLVLVVEGSMKKGSNQGLQVVPITSRMPPQEETVRVIVFDKLTASSHNLRCIWN